VGVFGWDELSAALDGAAAVINTTSLGLAGGAPLPLDAGALPAGAVVMDMVYRPLRTPLLAGAADRGLVTVDGLEMLIGQARPSFSALFGLAAPADVDVRAMALKDLEGVA
ncbi:MAG TPA: shikimate dehydrogenase, partial [Caulobacteraceae bacterium]|nr:shikimate dehydrogenase [Caulobacteraceae bacterium]